MYNFSDFIPIYTHLYDHIIFSVGKSTLNMSVKVKIRVRRNVTIVNQKKMVAIESDTQKLDLMVRILVISAVTWPYLSHLNMPSWPVWEWVMACNDPLPILDFNDWSILLLGTHVTSLFHVTLEVLDRLWGLTARPFQLRFRIIWGEWFEETIEEVYIGLFIFLLKLWLRKVRWSRGQREGCESTSPSFLFWFIVFHENSSKIECFLFDKRV